MNRSDSKQPMLFEVSFSARIRKDGYVSWGDGDGKAYVIASNFSDATQKAIKAFSEWKDKKESRKKSVLERITLIDNEPVF